MSMRWKVIKKGLKDAEPIKQEVTTNRLLGVETKRVERTAPLPSGESEFIEWVPSTGEAWDLKNVYFHVFQDTDATSGSYMFGIQNKTDSNEYNVLTGLSNYDNDLIFSNGHFYSADKSKHPPTAAAQQLVIHNLYFYSLLTIQLVCTNSTDVPLEKTRTYAAQFKKFRV